MSKELTKFFEVFGTKAPTYLEEYIIECIKKYNTMSWQAQREFVNEFYQGEYVSLCQWMLKQPL